jgi:hypothetical protein
MLVNSYQVSINMPLLMVRNPANILYLQNAMRPFATFDIADAAEGTGYHLNELPIWNETDDSFEEQGFHDQMGECGYESFEAA